MVCSWRDQGEPKKIEVSYKYSCASLYDCPAIRQNHITTIFLRLQLRLQNDGLNGGISLSDDRFPASETDFRFTMIKNSWSLGFKMAIGWRKCPPAVLRDGFLTAQEWKMAAPMEDLRWTVSFQSIGTHWTGFNAFQWAFSFHKMMFL